MPATLSRRSTPVSAFVARCRTAGLLLPLAAGYCLVTVQSNCSADEARDPQTPPAIQVLFLGGSSGSHRTGEMSDLVKPVLSQRGIELTYSEDIAALAPEKLSKFGCLLIYRDHGDLPAAAEDALVSYVESGKGLVVVHCGSHCFRNSRRYTALVGGRFARHGAGTFRARIVDAQHAALRGVKSFESWDETYVHDELSDDRRVLMAREEAGGYEPYTWVRQQGQGRVYYTALGHDQRTWSHDGFHRLLEAAIRWAAGRVADDAPPLEYQASDRLPNYVPGGKIGDRNTMQKPLSPANSMRHMHLPEGFRVELFAAEPDVVKPLAMAFDPRGRLWIIESVDYPNDVLDDPLHHGNDRIKICEDTDGDGRADKFTIFADRLNIPTGLEFAAGGVVLALAPHIVLLKDTDGDDVADVRQILYTGFGRADTHAVHANLHYGLDGWMWASVGYSGGDVRVGDTRRRFRMGLFRFRTNGSDLEFLTSTSNNTWGLGLGESGDVFASTANNEHSVHLAIPNRYIEAVRGWHAAGSAAIADHKRFHPVGDVRQVDWHGGFSAASGHNLYTARSFPREFWDRAALVCEPTGHLVHVDWLVQQGAGFVARDGYNLLASSDAWTSPVAAQVGPDGAVWVLDWYNYIVQHNPTPPRFATGKGNAYVTPLRDKSHGRIYRVVYGGEGAGPVAASTPTRLDTATPDEFIATLADDNLWRRLTAQRLLIESGKREVLPKLAAVVRQRRGQPAALHALRTIAGLGALAGDDERFGETLEAGLRDPSPGVRRAALAVLPPRERSAARILAADLLHDDDALARRDALLALADAPAHAPAAAAVARMLLEPRNATDPWIVRAATCAAARNDAEFLAQLKSVGAGGSAPQALVDVGRIVAEHYARGAPADSVASLLATLPHADDRCTAAVLAGLVAGWPMDHPPGRSAVLDEQLQRLLKAAPGRGPLQIAALARRWGFGDRFRVAAATLSAAFLGDVQSRDLPDEKRLEALEQWLALADPSALDRGTLERIVDAVTPRDSPALAGGVFAELGRVSSPELGPIVVARLDNFSPAARRAALALLLQRPAWTMALLDALDAGTITPVDLAIDQQQQLARHPDATIGARARKRFAAEVRNGDGERRKILESLLPLAAQSGDATLGRAVFEKNCAKCHRHGALGASIGPDLTGAAARSKAELLTEIIDPNRSVEGNFRQYTLVTADGRVLAGLLTAETRTTVELVDALGQRHVQRRDEIDQLLASTLSLMPEGFEKLPSAELTALLEFLATRGKYVPLPLDRVATIVSTRGMFNRLDANEERLIFQQWGPQQVDGVPFQVLDPRKDTAPNVILLHGPQGAVSRRMPKSVRLPCGLRAEAIHLLGGVSGWGFPLGEEGSESLIVRLNYADAKTEDHRLRNGEHLADYIRRVEVPGSKLAFKLREQQIRYLAIRPQRRERIESIEFIKGSDATAPVIMGVTIESPDP